MTDKQFKSLIRRTILAQAKFGCLLKKAEEEYERRFGENPSDIDDDFWIDSLHMGSPSSFEDILKNAQLSVERSK